MHVSEGRTTRPFLLAKVCRYPVRCPPAILGQTKNQTMQPFTKEPKQEHAIDVTGHPGIVTDKRNGEYSVYVEYVEPGKVYLAECLVRRKGSVRFFLNTYAGKPSELQVLLDTMDYGTESPRPYRAGQACDGSIAAPVFHLYAQLCDRYGMDPVSLYNATYPDDPISGEWLAECLANAEWQGVERIARWDRENTGRVLKSLTEANRRLLREKVEEYLLQ